MFVQKCLPENKHLDTESNGTLKSCKNGKWCKNLGHTCWNWYNYFFSLHRLPRPSTHYTWNTDDDSGTTATTTCCSHHKWSCVHSFLGNSKWNEKKYILVLEKFIKRFEKLLFFPEIESLMPMILNSAM